MPKSPQSKLVLEVVTTPSVGCWVDRFSPATFSLTIGGCFVTTDAVGVDFRATAEPPESAIGIAAAETGNATPRTAATNSALKVRLYIVTPPSLFVINDMPRP